MFNKQSKQPKHEYCEREVYKKVVTADYVEIIRKWNVETRKWESESVRRGPSVAYVLRCKVCGDLTSHRVVGEER